jgi:adenosylcobinamide kinase/adenosylcobinamide-phosphate guanylyltransferase
MTRRASTPCHELILGGQRSGKSRCAEARAIAWLATPGHEARLIATARAGDAEMAQRIAHHQRDRAERVPALASLEVPLDLAAAVRAHGAPQRLIVVDCLTLCLTNWLMPLDGAAAETPQTAGWAAQEEALCAALCEATGPVVLVSNEIGLGVSPMSAEARDFVDRLGRLHQRVAQRCERVTLMVAGIEVVVKAGPPPLPLREGGGEGPPASASDRSPQPSAQRGEGGMR